MSEGVGVYSAVKELFFEDRGLILRVGANACKGMLLRTCIGEEDHLQLWAQRAVQSYGLEVHRVPRAISASHILTHPMWE